MNRGIIYFLLFLFFASQCVASDPPDGENAVSEKVAKSKGEIKLVEENINYLNFISQRSNKLLDSIYCLKTKYSIESKVSAYDAANNDSLIKTRLKHLSEKTEIPLVYNESVKNYIKAYAISNPKKIGRILGEMEYYFPIFDYYLSKYELPPELKYLAAVESALDPTAVSKSGAVGLWQFLPGTAGLFDLEINSWVDERRDVFKSTDAACRYLEYLFRIYQDWEFALASYNGGPGAVSKAIGRSDGDSDYWGLRKYMSIQMQNYVPAFIAMNYVIAYHEDFSIKVEAPLYSHYKVDTIMVFKKVSFSQISKSIDLDVLYLKYLNPRYRKSVIPASKNGSVLVLPTDLLIEFVLSQNEIFNSEEFKQKEKKEISKLNLISYKVNKGESLHKIAIKFQCTIEDIMLWNNLSINHVLKYGETLKIYH